MNRMRVLLSVWRVAAIILCSGVSRMHAQQPASPPAPPPAAQTQEPAQEPAKTPEADRNPFAPQPAPPLPRE